MLESDGKTHLEPRCCAVLIYNWLRDWPFIGVLSSPRLYATVARTNVISLTFSASDSASISLSMMWRAEPMAQLPITCRTNERKGCDFFY